MSQSNPPSDAKPRAATSEEPAFAAQSILRAARKHLLLVLACWIAVLAVALFWSLGQSKVYRAEALLRLDPDPPKPLGQRVELVSGQNDYWNHREFYETEFRIMKSMRVTTAVVRTLGLNADPAFLQVRPKDIGRFKPIAVEEAARILAARLSVEPVKESSLTILRYEDTDPKRCQTILNAVIHAYLAQNLETNSTMSASALEWLNGQLAHLKVELEKSEVALTDFRQKNNVLSISLEDRHNMISAQLEQVQKGLIEREAKRYEFAARYAELAKIDATDPRAAGAADLLSSDVLSTLRKNYDEQSEKLQEMLAVHDDNHPLVMGARNKLAEMALAIKKEVRNIQTAAAGDLRKVDSEIANLKKKDEEIQDQAHKLQAFETPFNQLNREKTNNEKIYGLVLERARETDLTRMMNFNNIRVIDEPQEPRIPVRPNVPLNLAVGAFCGLLLGIGGALLRELSDRSLKTPLDVEQALGVTCLGLLPEIEPARKRGLVRKGRKASRVLAPALGERDLVVAAHPDGGVAEAARAIRTNLTFMSPDRPYHTIAITSAVPEEGKTTVACSLATVLAQSGLRVLLVDTDLRRPRLHRTFHASNDVGVTMAVSGQAPLDECIRDTSIPNLSLLTSGPVPPNPAEILQSEKFRELAQQLSAKFDRVIFDSPPILPVTDAAVLGHLVDGLIIVARGFRTQKAAGRRAVRLLQDVKCHIIGVVLNAVDLNRHDYRHYYYYYKRGGYYTSRPEDRAPAPPSAHDGDDDHTAAPPGH